MKAMILAAGLGPQTHLEDTILGEGLYVDEGRYLKGEVWEGHQLDSSLYVSGGLKK